MWYKLETLLQILAYKGTTSLSGTIKDKIGNVATLTLFAPGNANSLSGNKNLVIDTVGPKVLKVTSPSVDKTYKAGQTIDIEIQFDESASVTGTPSLTLNSAGTAL